MGAPRDELLAYNPAEDIDLGQVAARARAKISGTVTGVEMIQSWVPTHGDLGYTCRIDFRPKDKRRREVQSSGHGDTKAQAAEAAISRLDFDDEAKR